MITAAMAALPGPSIVHGQACAALANLCAGPVRGDEAAAARRRRANKAGAIEAVVAAGEAEGVGKMALQAICGEVDEFRQRALTAGASAEVFE